MAEHLPKKTQERIQIAICWQLPLSYTNRIGKRHPPRTVRIQSCCIKTVVVHMILASHIHLIVSPAYGMCMLSRRFCCLKFCMSVVIDDLNGRLHVFVVVLILLASIKDFLIVCAGFDVLSAYVISISMVSATSTGKVLTITVLLIEVIAYGFSSRLSHTGHT